MKTGMLWVVHFRISNLAEDPDSQTETAAKQGADRNVSLIQKHPGCVSVRSGRARKAPDKAGTSLSPW